MLAVGITTAPRDVSYIEKSLDSYFKQVGLPKPWIFAEPGSNVKDKRIESCITNSETLGVVKNWVNAAYWLLRLTIAPWIMICQDDILYNLEFYSVLFEAMVWYDEDVDVNMLSPHIHPVNRPLRRVYWNTPKRQEQFSGALCFCFKRQALYDLIHDQKFLSWNKQDQLDYAVSKNMRGILIYEYSLVTHIGTCSSILERS